MLTRTVRHCLRVELVYYVRVGRVRHVHAVVLGYGGGCILSRFFGFSLRFGFGGRFDAVFFIR